MQVSAISVQNNNGYTLPINLMNNRLTEQIGDTSFNSLTSFSNLKSMSADNKSMVFDSINQWKNFCHRQILGEKLDIIA